MSATATVTMTAEEFVAWAMEQAETDHFELVGGEVVAMAPERIVHAELKGEVFALLREAVRRGVHPCRVWVDGPSVRVNANTVFEPDVIVRCGPPLDGNVVVIDDPVIVVEVLTPSTRGRDIGAKFAGYFELPSLRHHLVVDPSRRLTLHHRRDAAGTIVTHIVKGGPIALDPPGIELPDIFADMA